jgi:seryl-tRNA synthetase
MINFNTEYFGNNCYFYIKDRGDKISLYYNVAETLTESRKSDEKIEFDKKDEKKVKGLVSSAMKTKSKVSKKTLDKKLKGIKSKKEIDELVDEDGSLLGSRIPNLSQILTPHKTMDQTVVMARTTNDPVTRGYRVYYGESEEGTDDVINEVDYSEAFGYEETKDMDYNDTAIKLLKKWVLKIK